MTRPLFLALALAVGGCAQDIPHYFELILPDFFENRSFTERDGVIELTPFHPLKNIAVLVLKAHERDIRYDNIKIKINGKGMGNAFDQLSVPSGTKLVMSEFNLSMRPDHPIDPYFEYAIEVSATGRHGGTYYQNWLLREPTGGQNRLFTHAGWLAPGDAALPDLNVDSPLLPIRLGLANPRAVVPIKGIVTGRDTVLSVNGQRVRQAPTGNFEATVNANMGDKEILLEAVNGKGSRRTTIIPIFRDQPARAPLRFAGKKYAILIGISEYGSSKQSLPRLPAASADAALLASSLQTEAGFAKSNVLLVRDTEATHDRIRFTLTEFAAQAGPNDLLLYYFAGHGLHDPAKPEDLYLAGADAQAGQLASTAIPLGDFQSWLDRFVKCRNTVLLFDVSYRLNADLAIRGQNLLPNYLLGLSQQDSRAVLVSTASGQFSHARNDTRVSSLFGEYLIKGLTREADLNGDRVVTSEELVRFVAEKVRQESKGEQTPRFLVPLRLLATPLAESSASILPVVEKR